ncbi:polysaccharide biosynthesis tyrosine autokinase [Chlorobium sp. N1]|uniref:GumC family protein n=1 Tax=Chlorobium sp. N1 TaxID=2491138 RepID=UPI001040C1C1|nr:polysaccharide biosynthesis tyrosine autokinase [Chlorobium sp. N1]TCD47185.1 polysaccharide biosynthesis tyrosine autokinase [Chlorobium sp. N1]
MHNDSRPLQKEINISEILGILWQRRGLMGSVMAVALLLALLAHFSATPEYRPSSIVLIKTDKSSATAEKFLDPFGSLAGVSIENDIELLKSFPLAEAAIRSLYYSNDRKPLELFAEREFVPKAFMPFRWMKRSGGGEEPQMSEEQLIRKYAGALQKRIMVANSRDTDILDVSVSSPFADESAVLTNALCRAYVNKDIEWNADQALQVKGFVSEQLVEQQAEIRATDERLSAYMKQKNIYELTGNAENLLQKLVEAESRYNDALSEYNILKKRQEYITRKLSDEERAFSAKVSRNIDRQAQELKTRIRQEETGIIGQVAATDMKKQELAALKQRLRELTRNAMAGELAFSNKARQFQFDLISEQLQTEIRLAELSYIADEYKRSKDYYDAQLNKLPQKQLEYARLQRDREVQSNTYTFLKGKLEESRIQIASEVGKVVVVGPAYPPERPVAPSLRKTLLVALMLGLGVGGALVRLLEAQDNSLRDDTFLTEHGFITLATIPYVAPDESAGIPESLRKKIAGISAALPGLLGRSYAKGKAKTPPDGGAPVADGVSALNGTSPANPFVLMAGQLSSHLAESFRDLRTNIIFSRADSELNSILVTGTSIGEGKSTVALNLAFSFALIGKKVLVVDCDLRRPAQHRIASVPRSPGLSNYLTGVSSEVSGLIKATALHERLFILPAGRKSPNPNELLGSNKMAELLRQLESDWDMVIIDSPPAVMLSDAAILSRSADAILMVARIGHSQRSLLREAMATDFVKKACLGVAVIGPQDPSGYGRYHGRYGYNGYNHAEPSAAEEREVAGNVLR